MVEIYAVDSNSGLRDTGRWASILAQGKISDQEFARLEQELEKRKAEAYDNSLVVRAFVVHHPLSLRSRSPFIKALFPDSVSKLLDLAGKYNIFAVLTGHTHRFHYKSYDITSNTGGRQLNELRSATTFQGPASNCSQGFIAHQILIEGNRLVWKAWQYKFVSNSFVCSFIQPGNQPWWQRPV